MHKHHRSARLVPATHSPGVSVVKTYRGWRTAKCPWAHQRGGGQAEGEGTDGSEADSQTARTDTSLANIVGQAKISLLFVLIIKRPVPVKHLSFKVRFRKFKGICLHLCIECFRLLISFVRNPTIMSHTKDFFHFFFLFINLPHLAT